MPRCTGLEHHTPGNLPGTQHYVVAAVPSTGGAFALFDHYFSMMNTVYRQTLTTVKQPPLDQHEHRHSPNISIK